MNRIRVTRRLTHAGCLATLAMLGLITGCSNAAGVASKVDPAPADPAPKTAALPVNVPLRSGFVRLDRGLHPFAQPRYDVGRLDPEQRISNVSLFFKLSPAQRADRDALVAAQVDPTSPQFRHWLTPETYAARFGARPDDIARASAWLRAQGFDVRRTSRTGTRVTFNATVKDLETAFQTEMHRYVVGGQTHFAMATGPAIPADLADVVLGLHHTHDFFKKPVSQAHNARAIAQAHPHYKLTFDAGPEAGADGGQVNLLAPPDWVAAYDVARLYSPGIGGQSLDGTGVTIGIVGEALIAQSDIDGFRAQFGIPALGANFQIITVPDTGPAAAGRNGDGLEAILDTEWSGSIAKGAKINFVITGSEDRDIDDASFYLIEENLAPVMSESFGGCEAGEAPSDADILEENGTAANLLGITYMASAGDDGAEDCGGPGGGGPGGGGAGLYVDSPGSFPGVTSVGGTQFPNPAWNSAGNLTGYPTVEAVWNEYNDPFATETIDGQEYDVGIAAGGGGISIVFPRPAYQGNVATCSPVGSLPVAENLSQFRQVPDLSFSAASFTPGFLVECTLNATGSDCAATGGDSVDIPIGGTSAASPSFAGVVAILNQAVGERLGNINPLLYAVSAATPAAFHDITVGNNEVACSNAGVTVDGGGSDGGWPDAGCGPHGLQGYPATVGYDCASGLGSLDGYNFVSAVVGNGVAKTKVALVADPISGVTPGEIVTLTATVGINGTTTNAADLTGAVVFTFESFTNTGATDLSWELGTAKLTGATSTSATATLNTAIPAGLVKPGHQFVDVVAVYGGDATHLSSTSPKVGIGFAPISFAIVPTTTPTDPALMEPEGTQVFTTTGGVPPIQWGIDIDTTSGRVKADGGGQFMGYNFGGAQFPGDGGALTVGPKAGFVEIVALDNNGTEALGYVMVGTPLLDGGAPRPSPFSPDAGPFIDAAVPPAVDAGVDAPVAVKDAGTDSGNAKVPPVKDAGVDSTTPPQHKDAGEKADAAKKDAEADAGGTPEVSQGGCNCEVRGGRSSGETVPTGALFGLAIGLSRIARRRRSGR